MSTQQEKDLQELLDRYASTGDEDYLSLANELNAAMGTVEPPKELPTPTIGMYEGMTMEQQQGLFKQYQDDPRVRKTGPLGLPVGEDTFLGELAFEDAEGQSYTVPEPTAGKVAGEEFDFRPDTATVAARTMARNVPANVADTIGTLFSVAGQSLKEQEDQSALGDAVGSGLNTVGDALTGFADAIPKVKAGDDISDSVTIGLTEFGSGGIFVAGLLKNLSGTVIKNTGKLAAVEASGVSTLGVDVDDGIVVGEDSLVGLDLDPFGANEEGISKDQKILRQKLNLVVDGSGFAKALEAGIGVLPKLGNFIGGTLRTVLKSPNKKGMQEGVVKDLVDTIASVNPEPGSNVVTHRQILDEVIRYLDEGDPSTVKILLDEGEKEVELILNTLQTLERNPKFSDVTRQQIRNMMDGVRGRAEVQVSEAKQVSQLESAVTDKATTLGKEGTSPRGTAEALTGAAREGDLATGVKELEQLEAAKAGAESKVAEEILQGLDGVPTTRLQEIIASAKEMGIVGLQNLKNKTQEQIADSLFGTWTSMTARKDELFTAVRGGDIGSEEGVDALINALDKVEALDPQNILKAKTGIQETQLEKLIALKKPRVLEEATEDLPEVRETAEEVAERLQEFFTDNADFDLGYFFREIRPQIAQQVDSILGPNGPINKDAAVPMRAFLQYIDSEMETLAKQGDEVGLAAKEAMDYFKGTYSRFWRDSPLQELGSLYRQTAVITDKGTKKFPPTTGGVDKPVPTASATNKQGEEWLLDAEKKLKAVIKGLEMPATTQAGNPRKGAFGTKFGNEPLIETYQGDLARIKEAQARLASGERWSEVSKTAPIRGDVSGFKGINNPVDVDTPYIPMDVRGASVSKSAEGQESIYGEFPYKAPEAAPVKEAPVISQTEEILEEGIDDVVDEIPVTAVDEVATGPTTLVKAPTRQKEETMRAVQEIVSSPERYLSFEQVAKLMDEAGEGAGDLHDLVYVDLISSLQVALKTQEAGTNTVPALLERVRQYASTLIKSDPQKAKQLDSLLNSLSDNTLDAAQLSRKIEDARVAAKTNQEEALDSVLGPFLRRQGLDVAPTAKPREALNKVLQSSELTELEDLVAAARATGNPKVLKGIQSEYLKLLRDKIFVKGGATAAKGRKASLAQIETGFDDPRGLMGEKLRIMFADDPQYVEGLGALATFIRDQQKVMQSAKAAASRSDTAEATARTGTMNQIAALTTTITATLGRLNRKAAVAGNIGGGIIRGKADEVLSDPDVARIFAQLIMDPQLFNTTLKSIRQKELVSKVVNVETLVSILTAGIRGNIFGGNAEALSQEELTALAMQLSDDIEAEPDTTDQQTEEALSK